MIRLRRERERENLCSHDHLLSPSMIVNQIPFVKEPNCVAASSLERGTVGLNFLYTIPEIRGKRYPL
jgi:hypothetical protein